MKERNFFESQTYLEKDYSNLFYSKLPYSIWFEKEHVDIYSR